MKKTLVAGLLGLATVVSVHAQGQIIMYNYSNLISYNSAPIADNVPAGVVWSIAMYGVAGDQVAAINAGFAGDGGYGNVAGVGGLQLATGTAGITAPGQFGTPTPPNTTSATFSFAGPGSFVVVAYTGASYNTAAYRGHSSAFLMDALAAPTTPLDLLADPFSAFAAQPVSVIPEPSTFALAGLGLAGLLIFRRRK